MRKPTSLTGPRTRIDWYELVARPRRPDQRRVLERRAVFERRPLSGAVKQRPGLVTVYGLLLNDAFNFDDHIRMQDETMGLLGGDAVIMEEHPEWVSTVYWYDERPG